MFKQQKSFIISLALVNDEIVSDFKQKVILFNNYFASQCTPIKNCSKLPNFIYKTEKKTNDILLIVKKLWTKIMDGTNYQ